MITEKAMLGDALDAIRSGKFRLEIFNAWRDPSLGIDIVDRENLVDVIEYGNAYVNAGGGALLDILIGSGTSTADQAATFFSNARAAIGVGDSATAVAAGQTDLQAATNKLRVAMNATFPSRAAQVMTWRATFGTSQANWQWNESGLFNSATAGTATMLCRALVGSPFTKTSALSIDAIYTITVP
jgi:hypothetical protein